MRFESVLSKQLVRKHIKFKVQETYRKMKSTREIGTSTYDNPNRVDVAVQTGMDVQHLPKLIEVNYVTSKNLYQCTLGSKWNTPKGRACGPQPKKKNITTQTHVEESGD